MFIVTLQVPKVKSKKNERPRRCPYCQGETFQRWGSVRKGVRDPHVTRVRVYRYRCNRCGRTFRDYPQGVTRASQTERMQALAALGWVFGLSYRGIAALYGAFGAEIERMSAWRDVQAYAGELEKEQTWRPVRVLGMDGAYVRGWGQVQPVLVTVDMGTGQPVALGLVDERDPQALKRFLRPLVERLGVSVVVSDDLASYKIAADELGLEQQICQFHVRRWVGRTLRELEKKLPAAYVGVVAEVKTLIAELPLDGDHRLLSLYRQMPENRQGRGDSIYSPLDQLRYLLIRLSDNWARFRVFDWQPEVPWTNNPTEQAIGKMKMRARTIRGYKTRLGMLNGLMASGVRVR